MSRKRQGTIEWKQDHWAVRLTLHTNPLYRPWFHLPPSVEKQSDARAAAWLYNKKAKDGTLVDLFPQLSGTPGAGLVGPSHIYVAPEREQSQATVCAGESRLETVEEYGGRWIAYRKKRRYKSIKGDISRLKTWVYPELGKKAIVEVQPADLRRLVEKIDDALAQELISGRTPNTIWQLARKMFRDSYRSKIESLRVRTTDPTCDVEGPEPGIEKSKTFLYPGEFLQTMNREDISVDWRRTIAIAIYTYTRPGELEALEWEDLDLERAKTHIHRAIDREWNGVKSTKTNVPRRPTLEPNIIPLLYVMREEARLANGGKAPQGRVVDMPNIKGISDRLRNTLKEAGVDREELYIRDATRLAIRFYDMRATGITWRVARGDSPLSIRQDAGHKRFSTTETYIREFGPGFGEPFPPLPFALLYPGGAPKAQAKSSQQSSQTDVPEEQSCALTGTYDGDRLVRERVLCKRAAVPRVMSTRQSTTKPRR